MASPDTTSGAATKSDVKNLKRQARLHDEEHDRAYQAGLSGDEDSAPSFDAPDSVQEAYKAGVEERGHKSASPRAGSPRGGQRTGRASNRLRGATGRASFGGPAVTRVSEQGASALLGAVAYALVVSYLRYGWPGVTGWFSAKFTNKVTIGAGVAGTAAQGAAAGAHAAAPGTWSTPPSSNPNWMGP